ncbi:PST family polysaccharide transporter [Salinibacter ruber]|uniref:MOP flippase family protein n=1 Tax=Salinibacter ruber TaxID=146919 RepID=UPI0021677EEB|nr:MOP flippase family protein [Salinibacter ruber]MCS4034707.1 PST family polysaccharide transporter [Salinibacter ruber]
MSEFREKTLLGLSWSVFAQVGKQAFRFIFAVILARLLSPREFGLVGMVMIFTGFAGLFSDLGLGAALVQKQGITEKHKSSVFWLNVGVGTLLTAIFVAGAPLVAEFYDEPLLVPITMVLGANFFIGGLSSVHQTLFRKKIDFKSLAVVEIASIVGGGTLGIWMAYTGFGVWSLVAKGLASSALTASLLWIMSPWIPRLTFDWEATKDLMGFSLNLLGEKSINYWVRKGDDILIGKVLGSDALGLYTKAYGVMLLPTRQISGVVSRVMFPSLSTIQENTDRVRRVFFRMTRTIALLTFPMMLGLLAVAESFVIGVFGSQWSEMIPILQVFCVIGLMQSVGTLKGNLFLSQGRSDLMFRLGLFIKPMLLTGIIVGLQWGVVGVAYGYATAVLLATYPEWRYAGQLVGFTYGDLAYELSGIFACATGMAAGVYALGFALPPEWPHWLRLLTQVPTGVVVYWGLVHSFGVQAYRETLSLLAEQWTQRVQSAPVE